MTIGLVQYASTNYGSGAVNSGTLTIGAGQGWGTPTPGNTIVLNVGAAAGPITWPAGFTEVLGGVFSPSSGSSSGPHPWRNHVAVKVATGAESSLTATFDPVNVSVMFAYEVNGEYSSVAGDSASASSLAFPSRTPVGGTEAFLLAGAIWSDAYGYGTAPTGYTYISTDVGNTGANSIRVTGWQRYIASASGAYTGTAAAAATVTLGTWQMVLGALFVAPTADFSHTIGEAGETIEFTDTSTGSPTSWAWTFGDGGTSTSQNPTHVYAVPGTYSVTLTVTNATGSDSVTHSVSILVAGTPDPVEPAGVLLEIYAADPGSARWDVAKWDVDSWGSAGWQDVTPYGVTVDIQWGATRPELGILSVPEAASWSVDYFDPDRILDPANEEGPYFGDLLPFLPIRVSHRGTVVRQGFATGIAHSYAKNGLYGYMRGADSITILANAQVPSDTALPDTLYARAVAAIEAAGLSVSVAAPVGSDPALTPWVTGTREWSAWEWIKDAAQEVLHIPIIGNTGTVSFRPWAVPLNRARSLGSPELIDLQSVVDYSGNFSVIQAREDEDTIVERRITPPPRYGARTYTRDEDTLDPGAWADAVLADRGLPSLLWKPGDMRPLTAVNAELLATIQAVELVSLAYPEADPPIFASGIVVGGNIHIEGKRGDAAIWRFQYELAQTATEPLIETGGEPTDYLLRTGGGEYLYPTGSA